MVSVEEAEKIILACRKDYGEEFLPLKDCVGRTLAQEIRTDRDLPPFDRVTMDGIAIRCSGFQKGIRRFRVAGIQAAGEQPVDIVSDEDCIEIMTGAALPPSADTVIPYEDIDLDSGFAVIKTDEVSVGSNIHPRGKDKKQHELLVGTGVVIGPAVISAASAVGMRGLMVKKNPRILILSTGDELVDIDEAPTPFQVRRSNNYALHAALQQLGIDASLQHLPDREPVIREDLARFIQEYDVLLLSGGVSMGKFDYIPAALASLQIKKAFHKIRQRPGKPFWFGYAGSGKTPEAGSVSGALIFAFPGNPVSAFLCFYRYFIPWFRVSMGNPGKPLFAKLDRDFVFSPALQYFLQVRLTQAEEGQLWATPAEGHGSGDFSNLLSSDAFLELPAERSEFRKGEVFPVWVFRKSG